MIVATYALLGASVGFALNALGYEDGRWLIVAWAAWGTANVLRVLT